MCVWKDISSWRKGVAPEWLLHVVYSQIIITGQKSPDLNLALMEIVRLFNTFSCRALNVLILRALFKETNARFKHCLSTLKYSNVEGRNPQTHFLNEEWDKNIVSWPQYQWRLIPISGDLSIEVTYLGNILSIVNPLNLCFRAKVSRSYWR